MCGKVKIPTHHPSRVPHLHRSLIAVKVGIRKANRTPNPTTKARVPHTYRNASPRDVWEGKNPNPPPLPLQLYF